MTIDELQGGYKVVGVSPNAPVLKPVPQQDTLQKIQNVTDKVFPGTKQIGESLGTIVAAGGRALKGDTKGAQGILDTQVSVPKLIGAYTSSGAQLAGFAGVGTGGGLLAQALKSAGIGSAMAGGESLSQGNEASKVLKDTAIGGAVGIATTGVANGLGAATDGLRALPQRLIRSATGQSKAEILAGKDISKYVLENKKIGTASQLINHSQKAIKMADELINTNLKNTPDVAIPVKNIIADIASSINQSGGEIDEIGVRTILQNLAPQVKKTLEKETLSLIEANQLRSQLDSTLGNKLFISSQVPYNKGVLMDFTNSIREQVKNNAPDGTRAAFNTLSKEIKLRDLLLAKTAQGNRNQLIGLGDLLSGGVGGMALGVPGALAAGLTKRAVESTAFKTGTAIGINHLDKALTPVLNSLDAPARTAVMNAIIQAINSPEN